MSKDVKRVVLADSGGPGTNITLRWLQDRTRCGVATVKRLLEIARRPRARAAGRANDQVRLELAGSALWPGIKLVAPCCKTGP
jgi:argininosuccinate synthase